MSRIFFPIVFLFLVAISATFSQPLLGQDAEEFAPVDFLTFRGVPLGGGLEELAFSDDEYATWNPGFILNACYEMPVWVIFDFLLDTDQPEQLFVTYETHSNTPNIFLAIQGRNWNDLAFMFEEIILENGSCHAGSEEAPPFFDAVRTIDLTERIDQLVEPGTGLVRLRFGWGQRGFLLVNPWQVDIDHVFLSK